MSVPVVFISKARKIHSLLGSPDFLGSHGHGLPASSLGQVTCALVLSSECSGFPSLGTVLTRDGASESRAASSVVGCLADPVLTRCQEHPRPWVVTTNSFSRCCHTSWAGWQGGSAQNHSQLRTIGLEELDWIVIISFYPSIFPFFASLFALNVFIPKKLDKGKYLFIFFVFSLRFPQ